MVTKIGLDLGYANITISDASLEVDREPSIAIIDKNTIFMRVYYVIKNL